jgi:hypothetical protein
LVAHSLWERGATGSNPVTPTRCTTSAHKFACSHTSRSLCADHSACARAVRGGARAGSAGRGAERPAAEHQQHRGEPGVRPPRQLASGNDGRAGAPRSVNCQDVELGLFRHAPQSDRSALSPRGLNFDPTVKRTLGGWPNWWLIEGSGRAHGGGDRGRRPVHGLCGATRRNTKAGTPTARGSHTDLGRLVPGP